MSTAGTHCFSALRRVLVLLPNVLLRLLSLPTTNAKDQVVDWTFGSLVPNYQVDLLQCQSLTFQWSSGVLTDVWEFPDSQAYNECDFSSARYFIAATPSGKLTLENDATLEVTKRWFGCRTKGHCR